MIQLTEEQNKQLVRIRERARALKWQREKEDLLASTDIERAYENTINDLLNDIEYCASLLDSDSQAAGESKSVMRRLEQQGAICRECRIERGYRPILDYVQLCPRHASMDDAATCMRDKCVDAIKSLRATPHGAAYNNAVNDAIRKCESLTLDELELEKQK